MYCFNRLHFLSSVCRHTKTD
jgi:hypothetical protein